MNHLVPVTALAIAACALPAHAANNVATAKISNFAITAFDLVPGDGYEPSFEVLAQGAHTKGELTRQGVGAIPSNGLPVEQTEKTVDGIFSPLSMSSSSAGQVLQLDVHAKGFDLIASGQGNFYSLEAKAFASNPLSYYEATIRLAPGTGIMASGTVALTASANCSPDHLFCGAAAGVSARFSPPPPSGSAFPHNATEFSYSIRSENTLETYTGPIGAGYFNYSNDFQDLTFQLDGSVSVTSFVPEPTACGLVLAGLLSVGLAGRRRHNA